LLAMAGLAGYLMGWAFGSRGRLAAFQAAAVLSLVVFVGFAGNQVLELVEGRSAPARAVARDILSRNLGSEVYVHGLKRSDWYGLNFYLKRETSEWLESPAKGNYVVTNLAGFLELERKGFRLQLMESGKSAKPLSLYEVHKAGEGELLVPHGGEAE